MRMIDADALVNELNEAQVEFDEYYKGLGKAKVIADNAPTVEPTFGLFKEMLCGTCQAYMRIEPERPTGEWIQDELHNVVCSNCGGIRRDNRVDYINYCNKCGAKMVKGENNV